MLRRFFQITISIALCGCQLPQKQVPAPPTQQSIAIPLITSGADYPKYVGKKIEVIGVVTNSKCPMVEGIDAWDLDAYRGKKVRVRGILRETVVTKEDIDRQNKIPIAHRGAGTFYSLEKMEFGLVP
jgi:hypothetical protein